MKKSYLAGAVFALAFLMPKSVNAMPQTDKVAHFGVGYIVNSELRKHTKLTFIERIGCVALVAGAKTLLFYLQLGA